MDDIRCRKCKNVGQFWDEPEGLHCKLCGELHLKQPTEVSRVVEDVQNFDWDPWPFIP